MHSAGLSMTSVQVVRSRLNLFTYSCSYSALVPRKSTTKTLLVMLTDIHEMNHTKQSLPTSALLLAVSCIVFFPSSGGATKHRVPSQRGALPMGTTVVQQPIRMRTPPARESKAEF